MRCCCYCYYDVAGGAGGSAVVEMVGFEAIDGGVDGDDVAVADAETGP